MHCKLVSVEEKSATFSTIATMLENTHAPTHDQYTLQVEKIFEVDRGQEKATFQPFLCLPNRQLLWHGSRLTNFAGILSQGLRIAPPEAPKTGYMFGKGLYFADMSSKAANYCKATPKNPDGLLLLCEVALGNQHKVSSATYVDAPPIPHHSVMGVGKTQPAPSGTAPFHSNDPNSPVAHSGAPVAVSEDSEGANGNLLYVVKFEFVVHVTCMCIYIAIASTYVVDFYSSSRVCVCRYNEYIVYDTAQVRIRYAVKCKFNFQQMFDED